MEDAMSYPGERRVLALFEHAHEAAMVCLLTAEGRPGRLVDVNEAACRLLGYSRSELLALRLQDVADPQPFEEARRDAGDGPAREHVGVLYHAGEGRRLCVTVRAQALSLADAPAVVFFLLDAAVQPDTALVQQRLSAIVESSNDAIIGKTLSGIITSWNAAAVRLYGYTAEEVVGRSIAVIIPPDRHDEVEDVFRRLRRGEHIPPFETVRVTKDGRPIDVSLTISPIEDGTGRIVGASAIARSIAEQKKAARELQARARQQAVVAELGLLALKSSDVEPLMEAAAQQVAETLQVAYCKVLALLPGRQELALKAGYGWQPGRVAVSRVDAAEAYQAGYTLAHETPVVVGDFRTEARFKRSTLLEEHGALSGMSVVIVGTDAPYGVLSAHAVEPRAFTEDDVHFLQAVANVLGAAAQRKRAEEALRQSQQDLTDFVENATVGMCWITPDGRVLWANQAQLDLLGYAREAYEGHPFSAFVAEAEDLGARIERNEELQSYEARLRAQDGTYKYVLISSDVFWKAGEVVHTRLFIRDITARKQAEEQIARLNRDLKRRIDELETLFDVAPVGLAVARDGQRSGITANPALADMLGIAPGTDLSRRGPGADGLPFKIYQEGEEVPADALPMQYAAAHDVAVRDFEVDVVRGDGRTLTLLEYASPLHDEHGRVRGCIGAFVDITSLKEAEHQLVKLAETLEQRVAERTLRLEQANRQLQKEVAERRRAEEALERTNEVLVQRNRELQDFAYVASHDLQEPLRKIRAFGDLLRTDYAEVLTETGRFYIGRIEEAAARMAMLINDLLAYSRIATQARPFTVVALDEVLAAVLSDLEVALADAGGRVEAEPLPRIEADATQMRQLLQNLISNSLKFHRPDVPPVVRVEAVCDEEPDQQGAARAVCRITVDDNGIGFDEKYLDRIFSPFQRLHGRGQYPGSGIGLSICRRIAERHGGSITASSTPGSGARFIITLPLRQQEEA